MLDLNKALKRAEVTLADFKARKNVKTETTPVLTTTGALETELLVILQQLDKQSSTVAELGSALRKVIRPPITPKVKRKRRSLKRDLYIEEGKTIALNMDILIEYHGKSIYTNRYGQTQFIIELISGVTEAAMNGQQLSKRQVKVINKALYIIETLT